MSADSPEWAQCRQTDACMCPACATHCDPNRAVLNLAYAVAEVAKIPVDGIAGYVVITVNLLGEVGSVSAGLNRDDQMEAAAGLIARLASSPVPDAVIIDGT